MPTIEEYFLTVINQLGVKRSSIASAIRNKGVPVNNNATFSDFPSLINSISTGGGGGSNVYYHSNNSQLADTYYATGSGGPQGTYGTYIKMPNTYHRGFNVYKHETNDYYLISTDDNGTMWEVAGEPSNGRQTRVSYWQESHSPDTLGPEGSYYYGAWNTNGDTCSFEISSVPNEGSSSSPSGSDEIPGTLYIVGTYNDNYNGEYTKQNNLFNGYARYVRTTSWDAYDSYGYNLFVINTTDGKHAWIFDSDTSRNNSYQSSEFTNGNGYMSTTIKNQSESLQIYPQGETFKYVEMGMNQGTTNPTISDNDDIYYWSC